MNRNRERRRRGHRPPARERGAAYVAVLGAALLVTVIGVAAMAAARVQRAVVVDTLDATDARLLAISAIDVGLARLAADTNWRSNWSHGVWTSPESLGDGTIRFKLEDAADTDLADSPLDDAKLHARASVGRAVRIFSVRLTPKLTLPDQNLADGGDFETGAGLWTDDGSRSNLRWLTDTPAEGNAYLRVTDRADDEAGMDLDVADRVVNGRWYVFSAWVRADSDTVLRVEMTMSTLLGGVRRSSFSAAVGTAWQRISGPLQPTWPGSLMSAKLELETPGAGTTAFSVDGLVLVPLTDVYRMIPVAGSLRQEVE